MPPSHRVTGSRGQKQFGVRITEQPAGDWPVEAVGRLAVNAPAGECVVLREPKRLAIGHTSTTPAVTARGYSAPQAVKGVPTE